jgi:hypothetical protein
VENIKVKGKKTAQEGDEETKNRTREKIQRKVEGGL